MSVEQGTIMEREDAGAPGAGGAGGQGGNHIPMHRHCFCRKGLVGRLCCYDICSASLCSPTKHCFCQGQVCCRCHQKQSHELTDLWNEAEVRFS